MRTLGGTVLGVTGAALIVAGCSGGTARGTHRDRAGEALGVSRSHALERETSGRPGGRDGHIHG